MSNWLRKDCGSPIKGQRPLALIAKGRKQSEGVIPTIAGTEAGQGVSNGLLLLQDVHRSSALIDPPILGYRATPFIRCSTQFSTEFIG